MPKNGERVVHMRPGVRIHSNGHSWLAMAIGFILHVAEN